MNILVEKSIAPIHMHAGDSIKVSFRGEELCSATTTMNRIINKIIVSDEETVYGMKNVLTVSMGEDNGNS